MTETQIKDIGKIWEQSKHEKPLALLLNNDGNYLIVISSTNRLHRCLDENGQLFNIPITGSPVNNVETNTSSKYLLECIHQDIDVFAREKIFPIIFGTDV